MSPYDFHHGERTRSGYTHISGMQPYASTPPLNFAAASSPIATQQYLADAGPSTSAANPTQTPPGARPKNVRTSKVKRTIVGRERGPESPKGRKPRHGQGSKDRRNQDDSEPKDPEGGSADDSAAAP
ncbi:hypothetical protein DL93DRAFT_2081031 [Clavulina sp. PMI_390]|nr:hypothetical protein DL93DRAFT_2081031 [Clavulina sp. PMI_390]